MSDKPSIMKPIKVDGTTYTMSVHHDMTKGPYVHYRVTADTLVCGKIMRLYFEVSEEQFLLGAKSYPTEPEKQRIVMEHAIQRMAPQIEAKKRELEGGDIIKDRFYDPRLDGGDLPPITSKPPSMSPEEWDRQRNQRIPHPDDPFTPADYADLPTDAKGVVSQAEMDKRLKELEARREADRKAENAKQAARIEAERLKAEIAEIEEEERKARERRKIEDANPLFGTF